MYVTCVRASTLYTTFVTFVMCTSPATFTCVEWLEAACCPAASEGPEAACCCAASAAASKPEAPPIWF